MACLGGRVLLWGALASSIVIGCAQAPPGALESAPPDEEAGAPDGARDGSPAVRSDRNTPSDSQGDGGGARDAGAVAPSPEAGSRDSSPDAFNLWEQACGSLATNLCERMNACEPFVVRARYGDTAGCAARTKLGCLAMAQAPGARLSGLIVDLCGRQLATATCPDVVSGAALASCLNTGARTDGQLCFSNPQCNSGYCRRSGGCGICAPRIAAGGKCPTLQNDQCQATLVCAPIGICATPAPLGAACNAKSRPCLAHLRCSAGVCITPVPLGGSCASDDCNELFGLWCNKPAGAMRGTCQASKIAGAGETCGATSAMSVVCAAGAKCQSDVLNVTRCLAPGADGQGCGPNFQNRGCLAPAECVDELCRLPTALTCS